MKNLDLTQVGSKMPETLRLPFLGLLKFGFFSKPALSNYFPIILLTVFGINLLIMAVVQFINTKKGLSDYVRNLEELCGLSQGLGKVFVVAYHNNAFMVLAERTELFWNSNWCNQQVKTELDSIHRLTIQLQKLFFVIFFIAIILTSLASVLEKNLAYGLWTLERHESLFHFVMVGEVVYLPLYAMFIWSLDCMYLGFCAEIVVQFRILRHCLEEVTSDDSNDHQIDINYLNKMKSCIQHHQMLLRFIKEFQQTFSLILLVQYCIGVPFAFTELIAALDSRSNQYLLKDATVFILLMIQICFYCIPSNYITEEALAVSDAVYSSKWYFHNFHTLKAPLLLMIQNSQSEITIKAGGLITINAETVVKILKVAWSTCSVMRGLRRN